MQAREKKVIFDDKITFTAEQIATLEGFTGTSAEIQSSQRASGQGNIVTGIHLSARQLAIVVKIPQSLGDTLTRYFIAGTVHQVRIDNRYVNVLIEQTSLYWPDNASNDPYLRIDMYAPDPLFYDVEDFGKNLKGEVPLFGFPWTEPTVADGISFGYKEFQEKPIITNVGDFPVGFIIRITAEGRVVDPIIQNDVTKEYIKVIITLEKGQVLEIATKSYRTKPYTNSDDEVTKYVTVDGVNAFKYIDMTSTFFELLPGGNQIYIGAAEGSQDMSAEMYYQSTYANGIEVTTNE